MTADISATSPGKLFLLGEYAVLEDGPAVLMPVVQRASVEVHSTRGQVTSITDQAITVSWTEASEKLPLLNSVQTHLGTGVLSGKQLTLDTSEFFRSGQKLGLGSSAALTVALVRACSPDKTPEEVYRLADTCHRQFQGGIGSGADIALSAMDQPVAFTRHQGPTAIELPDDLHMLAIWTGQSASTTKLVGSMQDYRDRDSSSYQQHVSELTEIANHCLHAISEKDSHQILARIEQYDRQLHRLSSDSDVNFYNELHEIMRKKVKLAYKPSGAGGGDFGIAYSTDKEEIIKLKERLAKEQIYAFVLGQN